MPRPFYAALLAAVTVAGVITVPAVAKDPKIYTAIFSKVAVSGYDPVAYFTDGKPVRGDKRFAHTWNGAEWQFASAEHRDLFVADPVKYAPQFGGYCAWAISQNHTASADPTAWRIVDGKLYLNYDADVQKRWEKDVPGNISKAHNNWSGLVDE